MYFFVSRCRPSKTVTDQIIIHKTSIIQINNAKNVSQTHGRCISEPELRRAPSPQIADNMAFLALWDTFLCFPYIFQFRICSDVVPFIYPSRMSFFHICRAVRMCVCSLNGINEVWLKVHGALFIGTGIV